MIDEYHVSFRINCKCMPMCFFCYISNYCISFDNFNLFFWISLSRPRRPDNVSLTIIGCRERKIPVFPLIYFVIPKLGYPKNNRSNNSKNYYCEIRFLIFKPGEMEVAYSKE